jgi:hypothetical protein
MRSMLVAAVWLGLALTPAGWTQYVTPGVALTVSTPGTNMRNAAALVHNSATIAIRAADDWGRRAGSAGYNAQQLNLDFSNSLGAFQTLRGQFNGLGSMALQTGRARAANVVAELGAGLDVIAELFTFMQAQDNAGTLDRATIARTCRALEDALREWDRELKRNGSRLEVAY